MYYWDLSALYPEDDNLSDSDGILYPVGQEQQVSSVESWLHTATEMKGRKIQIIELVPNFSTLVLIKCHPNLNLCNRHYPQLAR